MEDMQAGEVLIALMDDDGETTTIPCVEPAFDE